MTENSSYTYGPYGRRGKFQYTKGESLFNQQHSIMTWADLCAPLASQLTLESILTTWGTPSLSLSSPESTSLPSSFSPEAEILHEYVTEEELERETERENRQTERDRQTNKQRERQRQTERLTRTGDERMEHRLHTILSPVLTHRHCTALLLLRRKTEANCWDQTGPLHSH